MDRIDRCRGCLPGLAAGDAPGGERPGSSRPGRLSPSPASAAAVVCVERMLPENPAGKTYIPVSGKEVGMPTCSDCALYTKKTAADGECSINGPVPADRDAARCPSRTFRPR